jgi:MEMO1 family protein
MRSTLGQTKVRDATVAGIFYPDDPTELEERVSALLEAAKPSVSRAKAILAPHAGLDYSGDLSALAWKSSLGREIDTVVALSPLHRAEESVVYLPESDYFEIPTGRIIVDGKRVRELRDCGTLMSVNDIPHLEEHGIELQLPFMLALFPGVRLVPLLLGKPNAAVVKALASALAIVFGDRTANTLFVLSSDLGSSVEEHLASACADRFLRSLLSQDAKSMLEDSSAYEGSACGSGCVSAYLSSGLAGTAKPRLLGRHDSSASRETGEEKLVHYAAVAFSDE